MRWKLADSGFRNKVVTDTIQTWTDTALYPGARDVKLIWDATPKDSEMQLLIIRLWAKSVSCDGVPLGLPECFARMLIKELVRLRENPGSMPDPDLQNPCKYHEHKSGDACSQCHPRA